jgi:Cu/Ag efflux protein CusF
VTRNAWVLVVFCCLAALLCGCTRHSQRQYTLHGKIISVDRPRGQLVVAHGAIPGFMQAMTMDYTVKDTRQLADLRAGDQVQADLVVTDDGAWLEHVMKEKSVH